MLNDLVKLRSWYPVLPAPEGITGNYGTDVTYGPPWYISSILDMRVFVSLGTLDILSGFNQGFYALLTNVYVNASGHTNSVAVRIVIPHDSGNVNIDQTVPIYYEDSAANTSESYVIVDKSMRDKSVSAENIGAMLSNECVFIKQTPPSLYIYERLPNSKDETTASTNHYSIESFESGNNMDISVYNDTLTLTGGSGLGLGIHYQNPFTDQIIMNRKCGKGLRSISGITEDVSITADASVKVATTTSVDASGDIDEIRVTVRPSNADGTDML